MKGYTEKRLRTGAHGDELAGEWRLKSQKNEEKFTPFGEGWELTQAFAGSGFRLL